jgi:hypothetical protein
MKQGRKVRKGESRQEVEKTWRRNVPGHAKPGVWWIFLSSNAGGDETSWEAPRKLQKCPRVPVDGQALEKTQLREWIARRAFGCDARPRIGENLEASAHWDVDRSCPHASYRVRWAQWRGGIA